LSRDKVSTPQSSAIDQNAKRFGLIVLRLKTRMDKETIRARIEKSVTRKTSIPKIRNNNGLHLPLKRLRSKEKVEARSNGKASLIDVVKTALTTKPEMRARYGSRIRDSR
tara:strand:- start:118 stop:447 length:330 start_codon:yes stop_codon:yes gene_type:complete